MRSPPVAAWRAAFGLAALALSLGMASAQQAATGRLAGIQGRGALNCGIWPHVPGFAVEHNGRFSGFDIDFCRAVAAAIFGDADKVAFIPVESIGQFAARTDIDLVLRRLTWTLGREARTGMTFGPVTFYDGQGFLVPKSSGIRTASRLAGQRICVIDVERHAETVFNHFWDTGRGIELVPVKDDSEAESALRGKLCRAWSADISWLAAARSGFRDGPARYDILPAAISKEPLAPLMRAEDTDLVRLVRWTIFTMIEAEELGLNSRNIATVNSSSARVQHFLAVHPGSAVRPGAGAWVRSVIAGVGNYGEVYDRNLGAGSPLKLDRGLNRLWNQGGLLYAPPLDR